MYTNNDIRERLAYAIPQWWQDILEMRNIHDKGAEELAKYHIQFQRYVDGRSPITADAEKLIMWENLYDIKPDVNKPLEDRRALVLAKMRGIGIVTRQKVKQTAESFKYGEVDITENGGRVIVTFTSLYGIPPFLDDIKRVLRDLIPAHLEIQYRFLYNTYRDVYEGVSTYQALIDSELTYTELLTTELNFDGGAGGGSTSLEFYDHLDGTEIRNMTLLQQRIQLTEPLFAGTTTLSLGAHPFAEGEIITIYDDEHSENVEILIINAETTVVTTLQNSYKRGVVLARTNAVKQNGLHFGEWVTHTISMTEVNGNA